MRDLIRLLLSPASLEVSFSLTVSTPCLEQKKKLVAKIHETLRNPGLWSAFANEALYPLVTGLFQAAQAHNISVSDDKSVIYHVPSDTIEFDPSLMWAGSPLGSFAFDAIIGADNNNDAGVTVKNVFDVVVNTIRTISPWCK